MEYLRLGLMGLTDLLLSKFSNKLLIRRSSVRAQAGSQHKFKRKIRLVDKNSTYTAN